MTVRIGLPSTHYRGYIWKAVQCFLFPKVNHHIRVRLGIGLGPVTFWTSDSLDQWPTANSSIRHSNSNEMDMPVMKSEILYFLNVCLEGQRRRGSNRAYVIGICTRSSATAEQQRVSCPHGGGLGPPAHFPSAPLATPMRIVESKSHNVRTSSVSSVKRPLRWIGHSRSSLLVPTGIQYGLLS